MKILHDEPLAPYTSLRVGGLAEELVIADTYDDIVEALTASLSSLRILGFGCNILVSDTGLPGRTILWRSGDITVHDTEIVADAGAWWDDVVQTAIAHGLWGLELMSEIPSGVGGAIFGNIAAYGQQVSDTLAWVEIFDLKTHQVERREASDFTFRYRWSSFQDEPHRIILRAGFHLSKKPLHELRYDSALVIADELNIAPDTLENSRQIIVETRRRAGSIYHPDDITREHTAGSFFKNPLVSLEQARMLASHDETGKTLERIENQSRIHGGDSQRASAAHVLLAAGFARGQNWGHVRLHPHHVLKLETLEGATATEVYDVVQTIVSTVKTKLDITLEPEVKLLGF